MPNQESTLENQSVNLFTLRALAVLIGVLVCGWGIWVRGREGFATFLSNYGSATSRVTLAGEAAQLSSSNPEVHYVHARLLADAGAQASAIAEYERAAALRPYDYVLWLALGHARDEANDTAGALAAFKESTRLAPFYAKPHWQLGNTLFRAGRNVDALTELKLAAQSDPRLLPQTINLAWAALGSDAGAVLQALQPETPSAHMALASFFARHAKPGEALTQFRAAGSVSSDQRRLLISDLLSSKNFGEAYEVWSNLAAGNNGIAVIANSGFEDPINIDELGFGWITRDLPAAHILLDAKEPGAGSYSLRLDWSGESDPATPVISQLVLVEPGTHYRLSFAARTQDLLSVALPIVSVVDAGDDKQSILAQSKPLPRGTSAWQDYTTEFLTPAATRAVLLGIRRENCAVAPCAAVGHAWFDKFSLARY